MPSTNRVILIFFLVNQIQSFDKDGVIGYYFKKDDLNYICYERDGDFFSIYGSIDMDELIKIAAGITTE